MKRQVVLLLVIAMVLFCGCNKRYCFVGDLQNQQTVKHEDIIANKESVITEIDEAEVPEDNQNEEIEHRASMYQEGEAHFENGNLGAAAIAFGKAGDYLDADQRSKDLWNRILDRKFISAVGTTTYMISREGALVSTRPSQTLSVKETEQLGDIISISGYLFLRSDGTVFSMFSNYPKEVEGWVDIVDVSYNCGIKKDGTVVETRTGGQEASGADKFKNVISVSGPYGLCADGTVFYRGWASWYFPYWEELQDIVEISGSDSSLAAIREDGKVVGAGYIFLNVPRDENYLVFGWDNVIDVEMSQEHAVALKVDGTVAAVGDNTYGQCNVGDWTDIIAISCGYYHTVGVKSDGTVVATGASQSSPDSSDLIFFEQCEVDGWNAKLPSKP